eukprot:7376864-Prymnesium_polylepis.1
MWRCREAPCQLAPAPAAFRIPRQPLNALRVAREVGAALVAAIAIGSSACGAVVRCPPDGTKSDAAGHAMAVLNLYAYPVAHVSRCVHVRRTCTAHDPSASSLAAHPQASCAVVAY